MIIVIVMMVIERCRSAEAAKGREKTERNIYRTASSIQPVRDGFRKPEHNHL